MFDVGTTENKHCVLLGELGEADDSFQKAQIHI